MRYLHVSAAVRYWEDARVNGVEDTKGALIPFRNGPFWCPIIDLETGTVVAWPEGMVASIHYKVCDAGHYWLSESAGPGGERLKWAGDYVPAAFLCHGDRGYGDYIIFDVDADGKIANFRRPTVDPGQWVKVGGAR